MVIAIAVVSNDSDQEPETAYRVSVIPEHEIEEGETKAEELKSKLETLKGLEQLKQLEKLDKLENLESLKSVANFLPKEFKEDFVKEIEAEIKRRESTNDNAETNTKEGAISSSYATSSSSDNIWNAVSPGIFAYTKEFNVSNLEEATINLPSGSITVMGNNTSRGKIYLEASGQISTRNDLLSDLDIKSDIQDDEVVFQVTESSGRNTNINLQATLYIPVNTAIELSTKEGHITAKNFTGEQDYNTGGGHINLRNTSGDIYAFTSGGHIEVKEASGSLDLESKGGHVHLVNSSGEITMTSSGGNLSGDNISGNIVANTHQGNIEFRLSQLTDDLDASTGAGSVIITLPANSNADIEFAGTSLDIDSAFNFTGKRTTKTASGEIGKGGASIKANTKYGKVFLKKDG